jgi:hypothetical protein
MLTMRCTYLLALAVLVTISVAMYPYLGAHDMCDSGNCPLMVSSSAAGSAACLVVVLAAAPVMQAVLRSRLRGAASEPRPLQVFSSPDPPPPRSFS